MSQTEMQQALATLREGGHKTTRSRKALLETLLQDHGPFSIEDLQQRLGEACDLATIYRNMALFESLHLVESVDFGDGLARYEWASTEHEHHHHIICQHCHKVEQLEFCFVKELEKLVQKRGYSDVSHRMEFYGTCERCREQMAAHTAP